MSTRVHTTVHSATDASSALGVEVVATSDRLVELFGDEFADVPTPALVIEDNGNGEAWVVTGDLLDFAHHVHTAITKFMR